MTFDIVLPPEMWEHILGFLEQNDEFMTAMVCRDFYEILKAKLLKRCDDKWYTYINPYCNTPRRANAVWENVAYHDRFTISSKIKTVAAQYGYADTLIYYIKFDKGINNMFSNYDKSGTDEYNIALENKQYACVRAMICAGINVSQDVATEIIKSGHLDLVKLALANTYTYEHTLIYSIDTGNLDIIRYIYSLLRPKLTIMPNTLWCVAIRKKQLDIIKCIHEEFGIEFTEIAMQNACNGKSWDIVEYIISNNGPIYSIVFDKLKEDNPDLASKVNPATIIADLPITVKRTYPSAWASM